MLDILEYKCYNYSVLLIKEIFVAHNSVQEAVDSLLEKQGGDVKKAIHSAKVVKRGSKTDFRKEFWQDVIYQLKKLDLQYQLDNLDRDYC